MRLMLEHSVPHEKRVLVAVSGGPDSTALLIALQVAGIDVVAVHYDHALREGSDRVAGGVAQLCAARGIPLISERRNQPLPKGSLQAAARELRYAFFERARVEAGANVVAIAHTADDLVEGMVLHMLRGCGLAGFRGMPERRERYIRPWLDVWRSEVREFLADRGIDSHEDPANLDLRFARVRVRLQILPALERDRPGITRRFHAAARTAARLQEQAERVPTPVERLKRLYAEAGGPQPGLSRRHIDAMLKLAVDGGPGGRGVDLPGALRFRIVGGRLQMTPAVPVSAAKHELLVKRCRGCDDAEVAHLRPGLSLRVGRRQPGLRLRPAGGRGTRKLQDIFVDAKVPREDRDSWPLVFAGDRLAWVPGLAVEAELVSEPGESALHVAVLPKPGSAGRAVQIRAATSRRSSEDARVDRRIQAKPEPSRQKVVRLETPIRPAGDQI